jgi:hypothetical protein
MFLHAFELVSRHKSAKTQLVQHATGNFPDRFLTFILTREQRKSTRIKQNRKPSTSLVHREGREFATTRKQDKDCPTAGNQDCQTRGGASGLALHWGKRP